MHSLKNLQHSLQLVQRDGELLSFALTFLYEPQSLRGLIEKLFQEIAIKEAKGRRVRISFLFSWCPISATRTDKRGQM
jgi:hypothetical protein